MAIVDCAVYVEGARAHETVSVEEAVARAKRSKGFAWVGLLRPSEEELDTVAEAFGVHALAVEDARKGHQRSKLERYGENLALVVRAAHYDETTETVGFGDIHLFVTPAAVVSIRLADEPDLSDVRVRLENEQPLLAHGPNAVLYALLDQVVDSYAPVVAGLENDIDEVEDQIFAEQVAPSVSRRIYALHREVIGFQRAVEPLGGMLEELRAIAASDEADIELRRHFRDVHDHVIRVADRIENFRSLLDNALSTHLALVAHRQTEASLAQNEQTKMISAWAAILFAPSLVGTVYGMNFAHMPELHWVYGYPLALGLMVGLSVTLFAVFKKARWI
ncbi:magnesium and cobalt transport protein CorA [Demequina sp.]|uniref:magnesium and cobalt transport protein CorA n=1 Tax=Demequina sp. TaxID=2050685 RepID=UPI0025C5A68E|nr:magnesium and cobalt transport protein CorA [Demequina sp.]